MIKIEPDLALFHNETFQFGAYRHPVRALDVGNVEGKLRTATFITLLKYCQRGPTRTPKKKRSGEHLMIFKHNCKDSATACQTREWQTHATHHGKKRSAARASIPNNGRAWILEGENTRLKEGFIQTSEGQPRKCPPSRTRELMSFHQIRGTITRLRFRLHLRDSLDSKAPGVHKSNMNVASLTHPSAASFWGGFVLGTTCDVPGRVKTIQYLEERAAIAPSALVTERMLPQHLDPCLRPCPSPCGVFSGDAHGKSQHPDFLSDCERTQSPCCLVRGPVARAVGAAAAALAHNVLVDEPSLVQSDELSSRHPVAWIVPIPQPSQRLDEHSPECVAIDHLGHHTQMRPRLLSNEGPEERQLILRNAPQVEDGWQLVSRQSLLPIRRHTERVEQFVGGLGQWISEHGPVCVCGIVSLMGLRRQFLHVRAWQNTFRINV